MLIAMTATRTLPSILVLAVVVACGPDEPERRAVSDTVRVDTSSDAAAAREIGDAPDPSVLSVCDTLTNSFDCARAVEDLQLPDAEGVARRGDTLVLVLVAGDTLRLVDEAGDHSDVVYYSYQGRWREPGHYLVHRQYYEGADHLLVDDSTGEQTVVPDRPLRAPDGRRFAVLSLDLVAGYGPNTLQIWSFEDGRTPVREWETEPDQWGPTDGVWRDASTLRFTQQGFCEALGGRGRDMCERPALLRHRGGDWHLEAGSEVGG